MFSRHLPVNQEPAMSESTRPVAKSTLVRRGELADREHFIRWYQDSDIAELLRHDLKPLTTIQARGYFDSVVMPASSAGTAWAIHDRVSGNLIGTTAVTQVDFQQGTCLFRIVIGEKQAWGHGFGTDATRLVAAEVFETLGLDTIHLEVFEHNPRAHHVYERIGFVETGRSVEWAWHRRLDVIAMELTRATWESARPRGDSTSG
jgi:RimJ/RimL family protein N-acetyltransferase